MGGFACKVSVTTTFVEEITPLALAITLIGLKVNPGILEAIASAWLAGKPTPETDIVCVDVCWTFAAVIVPKLICNGVTVSTPTVACVGGAVILTVIAILALVLVKVIAPVVIPTGAFCATVHVAVTFTGVIAPVALACIVEGLKAKPGTPLIVIIWFAAKPTPDTLNVCVVIVPTVTLPKFKLVGFNVKAAKTGGAPMFA